MTYKGKFIIIASILSIVILASIIMFLNNEDKGDMDIEEAAIEVESGTDRFGNKYVFDFYEEEQFGTLNIYMEEDKDSSWQWSDYQNSITCNYIQYQDDHYVISFKANDEYTEPCKSFVTLLPLEDVHSLEHEVNEYNSFIIEIVTTEDGAKGYKITPAIVQDEYTNESDTHVDDEPDVEEVIEEPVDEEQVEESTETIETTGNTKELQ